MIKSHAEFKRILAMKGTKLQTLSLANGVVSSSRMAVGEVRHIRKADSTGVYLVKEEELGDPLVQGSFLGFDKASDWTYEGDIAKASWGGSYLVIRGSK